MKNQLTPLQVELLEMLKWFHNLCVNYGINYCVLGGTMLGAIRHQGFIPWDDDIDVGLFRCDYEKLRKLSKECNNGRYRFEFPDSDDEVFATPYAKLYDTSTILVENYRERYARGIFIDVFPLDGMGNTKIGSRYIFVKQKIVYDFFMTRVARINCDRSVLKNVAIIVSRLIPEQIASKKMLRISMDTSASKRDINNCKYGGNVFGNWGYREIMPTYVYGNFCEYVFEDIVVFGVQNYDEYLTRMYGNWRELPPKDKQISHHDYFYLSLDESFLNI